MDRRWQKEGRGRYETLEGCSSFISHLPPLAIESNLQLANSSDVYAVYSNLHSKGRQVEVKSHEGSFWFLLASSSSAAKPNSNSSPLMDVVVPVSSKHTGMTVEMMQKIVKAKPSSRNDILLAPVDDDGSVSLLRVFDGLVPPPSAD
jgi:hypothetical protein